MNRPLYVSQQINPTTPDVIAAADALTANDVRLSEIDQLRMKHKGIIENPITRTNTAPTWGTITDPSDPSHVYEGYIAGEDRPLTDGEVTPYAFTDDGLIMADQPGTFTEVSVEGNVKSFVYAEDPSAFAVGENGLIEPVSSAMAESLRLHGIVAPTTRFGEQYVQNS